MGVARSLLILFLAAAFILFGCLSTPVVDQEKAELLAGVRFLETHPGLVASYKTSDPGGEAYIIYFNITTKEGAQTGFAEYYVDRYTKDVYVSSNYATVLALEQSSKLKRIFDRYQNAKSEGSLIKDEKQGKRRFVWKIQIVANGVDLGYLVFDAETEKVLSDSELKPPRLINIQTA